VFSFYLPIYAFWHFDDFSWGNTRRVVGDDGKEHFIVDAEEVRLLIPLPFVVAWKINLKASILTVIFNSLTPPLFP
jgi:Chitin synthase